MSRAKKYMLYAIAFTALYGLGMGLGFVAESAYKAASGTQPSESAAMEAASFKSIYCFSLDPVRYPGPFD